MRHLGLLVAASMLVPATSLAQQPVFSGHEIRVTTNLADQYDPAISGNLVVYTDRRGLDADVYYTDLNTMQEVRVTNAVGDQELTDVSDGIIAFTDSNNGDVYVYSTASGTSTNLTPGGSSTALEPGIGQGLVAWEDNRDGNFEIYAEDLGTGEVRRITNDPRVDIRPSVDSGLIVWQSCDSQCDIYAYDWASATTLPIAVTADRDEREPDVFQGKVVFEAVRNGERDIYLYDLSTKSERTLSLPGEQANPNISGDFVAFEDLGADGLFHIKLWHLPSNLLFGIDTQSASAQFLNDLDGNRVVYTDDRNGQLDIYLYEFSLTFSNPAPKSCADVGNATPLLDVVLDRAKGKPTDYSLAFAAKAGPGLLCIDNGAKGAPMISAAQVSLNGALVLDQTAFVDLLGAPKPLIEAHVALEGKNLLLASLMSKPTAAMRVRVFSAGGGAAASAAVGVGSGAPAVADGSSAGLAQVATEQLADDSGSETGSNSYGLRAEQPAMGCSQGGEGMLVSAALILLVVVALFPRPALARRRIRDYRR